MGDKKVCVVCEDTIPEGWDTPSDMPALCNKKRCWEIFLPVDLSKKYFTMKTRFDLLKEPD